MLECGQQSWRGPRRPFLISTYPDLSLPPRKEVGFSVHIFSFSFPVSFSISPFIFFFLFCFKIPFVHCSNTSWSTGSLMNGDISGENLKKKRDICRVPMSLYQIFISDGGGFNKHSHILWHTSLQDTDLNPLPPVPAGLSPLLLTGYGKRTTLEWRNLADNTLT